MWRDPNRENHKQPPRQRVRNAAGWLVFVIEKTKEQSTNLCAAPYKSRSFSILCLLYTHSVRNSRIFSENEKSGMEHRCAPLPTKAIAFQFCRYYTFILRNCQDMNFVRRIKRNPRPAFLPAWEMIRLFFIFFFWNKLCSTAPRYGYNRFIECKRLVGYRLILSAFYRFCFFSFA